MRSDLTMNIVRKKSKHTHNRARALPTWITSFLNLRTKRPNARQKHAYDDYCVSQSPERSTGTASEGYLRKDSPVDGLRCLVPYISRIFAFMKTREIRRTSAKNSTETSPMQKHRSTAGVVDVSVSYKLCQKRPIMWVFTS